jgi:flagellar biogenesis protein FliO
MSALLLQTTGALGFVILLIAGAAWLYRKRRPGGPGPIGLLAYQPFGPRRGLAAVRIGREVLILGVTGTDLKLFRVVDAAGFDEASGADADRVRRLRRIKEGLDG